jgi:osmoprotectant transport system substrate-binding protein
MRCGDREHDTHHDPTPAQDQDSVTVTQATAKKYHLKSIEDLQRVAGSLTIGGPSEFQQRQQGLLGLQSVYGLQFGNFEVLDESGPLSLEALRNGSVQAADIFTTDPDISTYHLVTLTDPKHLFTAGNIVPLGYRPGLSRTIEDTLNAVSAQLTTASLQEMNRQLSRTSIDKVATRWLTQVGLAGTAR